MVTIKQQPDRPVELAELVNELSERLVRLLQNLEIDAHGVGQPLNAPRLPGA